MGFFGTIDQSDFDSFRVEIQELLKSNSLDIQLKLETLESKFINRATDSEEIARTAANSAREIALSIQSTRAEVEKHMADLTAYKQAVEEEVKNIQEQRTSVTSRNAELFENVEKSALVYDELMKSKSKLDEAEEDVAKKIESINKILEESKSLPESVASTTELLNKTKSVSESIQDLLTHSLKRKSDIDDLHKEILGADIKNDEGDSEHIDGLKDQLDSSYQKISAEAKNLEESIQQITKKITETHTEQLDIQKEIFEKLIADSNSRISSVNDQLTGLLPGAMAEGLSAAYEKKKDDEIQSSKEFQFSFMLSIGAMVLISLIPFGVNIYLLGWKNHELVQVIKDTPSLVIAILPLYFPVLWFAFSSNKKLNLSKRLIEEYTHKAVLGKTFSGLSNQIETLPHQSAVREELRTRLLFNVLQVSAENPGKLITNYHKSDHPLMEALENSSKLSDSVDTLSKLPGFGAIAKKLSTQADKLLKEQNEKIEKGMAIQEALKAPDESEEPDKKSKA